MSNKTKKENLMKNITLKLSKEELVNLTRLLYQDLVTIKNLERYGELSLEDKLAQKFGNKFLPRLCKILNIKQPQEAA
jgi:hypothetical protein